MPVPKKYHVSDVDVDLADIPEQERWFFTAEAPNRIPGWKNKTIVVQSKKELDTIKKQAIKEIELKGFTAMANDSGTVKKLEEKAETRDSIVRAFYNNVLQPMEQKYGSDSHIAQYGNKAYLAVQETRDKLNGLDKRTFRSREATQIDLMSRKDWEEYIAGLRMSKTDRQNAEKMAANKEDTKANRKATAQTANTAHLQRQKKAGAEQAAKEQKKAAADKARELKRLQAEENERKLREQWAAENMEKEAKLQEFYANPRKRIETRLESFEDLFLRYLDDHNNELYKEYEAMPDVKKKDSFRRVAFHHIKLALGYNTNEISKEKGGDPVFWNHQEDVQDDFEELADEIKEKMLQNIEQDWQIWKVSKKYLNLLHDAGVKLRQTWMDMANRNTEHSSYVFDWIISNVAAYRAQGNQSAENAMWMRYLNEGPRQVASYPMNHMSQDEMQILFDNPDGSQFMFKQSPYDVLEKWSWMRIQPPKSKAITITKMFTRLATIWPQRTMVFAFRDRLKFLLDLENKRKQDASSGDLYIPKQAVHDLLALNDTQPLNKYSFDKSQLETARKWHQRHPSKTFHVPDEFQLDPRAAVAWIEAVLADDRTRDGALTNKAMQREYNWHDKRDEKGDGHEVWVGSRIQQSQNPYLVYYK